MGPKFGGVHSADRHAELKDATSQQRQQGGKQEIKILQFHQDLYERIHHWHVLAIRPVFRRVSIEHVS